MSGDYEAFLRSKEPKLEACGIEPGPLHPGLYPFQADCVRWAVRLGRGAFFQFPGLGKTWQDAEWIRHFAGPGRGHGLIVAPLGVANQTIEIMTRMGIPVKRARERADVTGQGIYITNYERVERFAGFPWGAIVLDESGILKSIDGATRTLLLEKFTSVPRRLCSTATPAPNDVTELANHAEFLGVATREEMLSAFFVHDSDNKGAGGNGWRLKGHAQKAFWRWMSRWAIFLRSPADLGYPDGDFVLPELRIHDEIVRVGLGQRDLLGNPVEGLGGIGKRSAVRRATIDARVAHLAKKILASADQWVVWCGLNDEGRDLAHVLGSEAVLVEGADSEDEKVDREAAWRRGDARVMVTKSRLFGLGMNWQHCHKEAFLGLGDSFEAYFQAMRRCHRFGQKNSVDAYIVLSDLEAPIAENVRRKEREFNHMAESIVAASKEIQMEEVRGMASARDAYEEAEASGKDWRLMLGDSVKRIAEVPDASVGLSVFSPPFSSLYCYSPSERDMGNNAGDEAFFQHFGFLIPELLRVTKPGRLACVHVQQLTNTLTTHGEISVRDFRGDVIRAFQSHGWLYNNDITVDKDPQAQAIRTKSHALLFVQKNKDSSRSRPALADYIILFKKPDPEGKEARAIYEPVATDVTNEEWILWARPVWYNVRESDTLKVADARAEEDEKHICPLQLETIERCVRLWSNKGDVVFDPFAGIGSTGYVAVRNGRRSIGIELKRSYFDQNRKNLSVAVAKAAERTFFDVTAGGKP